MKGAFDRRLRRAAAAARSAPPPGGLLAIEDNETPGREAPSALRRFHKQYFCGHYAIGPARLLAPSAESSSLTALANAWYPLLGRFGSSPDPPAAGFPFFAEAEAFAEAPFAGAAFAAAFFFPFAAAAVGAAASAAIGAAGSAACFPACGFAPAAAPRPRFPCGQQTEKHGPAQIVGRRTRDVRLLKRGMVAAQSKDDGKEPHQAVFLPVKGLDSHLQRNLGGVRDLFSPGVRTRRTNRALSWQRAEPPQRSASGGLRGGGARGEGRRRAVLGTEARTSPCLAYSPKGPWQSMTSPEGNEAAAEKNRFDMIF